MTPVHHPTPTRRHYCLLLGIWSDAFCADWRSKSTDQDSQETIMTTRTLTLSAVAFVAGIGVASAQTAPGPDPHHPGTDAAPSQTKPVPTQRPAARGSIQSGM